jgi:hypothetical protein
VLRGGAKLIRNWVLLNKPEGVMKLERRSIRPPRLTWNSGSSFSGGASASPSEATVSVQSSVSGRVVNAVSVAELDVLLVNQLQSF